jgi:hypothetical protein
LGQEIPKSKIIRQNPHERIEIPFRWRTVRMKHPNPKRLLL